MANLYRHNNTVSQWSTGGTYLHFLWVRINKLITGVVCEFPAIKAKQTALLDTGAELSVIGDSAYQSFLYKNIPLGSHVGRRTINTRFDKLTGF